MVGDPYGNPGTGTNKSKPRYRGYKELSKKEHFKLMGHGIGALDKPYRKWGDTGPTPASLTAAGIKEAAAKTGGPSPAGSGTGAPKFPAKAALGQSVPTSGLGASRDSAPGGKTTLLAGPPSGGLGVPGPAVKHSTGETRPRQAYNPEPRDGMVWSGSLLGGDWVPAGQSPKKTAPARPSSQPGPSIFSMGASDPLARNPDKRQQAENLETYRAEARLAEQAGSLDRAARFARKAGDEPFARAIGRGLSPYSSPAHAKIARQEHALDQSRKAAREKKEAKDQASSRAYVERVLADYAKPEPRFALPSRAVVALAEQKAAELAEFETAGGG